MDTAKKPLDGIEKALKVHTVIMLTILIVSLLVIGNCYNAFADSTQQQKLSHGFYGLEEIFNDPNSKVKLYKSGGFSIKNPDLGIAIFAHPISKGEMYKFTVIESIGKVSRFLIETEILSDDSATVEELIEKPIQKRIEPKSSIGSDLSKWDIPTQNPRSQPNSILLSLKSYANNDSINLGETFEHTFRLYDARNNQNIQNVDVSLEISRDDFIYKSVNEKTSNGGMVHFKILDLDYPLFYPKFCYDVKVTASYGNVTALWTDDFIINFNGAWNPNFDWMGEKRWSYLPNSFNDEPRKSIQADENCN